MKTSILFFVCSIITSPFLQATAGCPNTHAEKQAASQQPADPNDEIGQIISKMQNAAKRLTSCQARLSYLFIQDPELLDSRTLQNGWLYYLKDNDGSHLRIRFDDIKQDDFEQEKRHQEYLFDGVWLTRIDYKLKQIDRIQKAPKDKPIGVFELLSNDFPLVGFSDIDQLREDFDIRLPEKTASPDKGIQLLLTVKKGSKYEKEYKKIDFWVNRTTFMPERIVAHSSQGDLYDIQFKNLQFNKKLKKSIFTIETPPHFRQNIEQLEKKTYKKGD